MARQGLTTPGFNVMEQLQGTWSALEPIPASMLLLPSQLSHLIGFLLLSDFSSQETVFFSFFY